MSKPTTEQIRTLMDKQHYENYTVNDARTFPWCLPKKPNAEPYPQKASLEVRQKWVEENLTEKGKEIYAQAYQGAKPVGLSPPNSTAKTFVNARKQTSTAAECSNFARHAIGTLIQNKDITDSYNIVYAGIMGGSHNIAVLVPKDKSLKLSEGNPPKLTERLPEGSLFIDPWAFGMGHKFEASFCCTQDTFAFRDSLNKVTIHYQSKNDQENVAKVQDSANLDDETIKLPDSSSSPSKPKTKLIFDTLIPVREENKSLLNDFDKRIGQLKQKAINLEDRKYPDAAKEVKDLYNKLVKARNNLIKQDFSVSSKSEFANKCNSSIEETQKGELKNHRGFKRFFTWLKKAVGKVMPTDSVKKMEDIKASLQQFKKSEQSFKEDLSDEQTSGPGNRH